jgi:hypothetical protein
MHSKVLLYKQLISGSIAVAGSAVQWARDQLGIIRTSDEIGKLASKVDGQPIWCKINNRHCRSSLHHCLLWILGAILAK